MYISNHCDGSGSPVSPRTVGVLRDTGKRNSRSVRGWRWGATSDQERVITKWKRPSSIFTLVRAIENSTRKVSRATETLSRYNKQQQKLTIHHRVAYLFDVTQIGAA